MPKQQQNYLLHFNWLNRVNPVELILPSKFSTQEKNFTYVIGMKKLLKNGMSKLK
jgi:hypothetical protein